MSKPLQKYRILIGIILAVAIVATVKQYSSASYTISNKGMAPEINVDQTVAVNKLAYGFQIPWKKHIIIPAIMPKRGDIIAYQVDGSEDVYIRKIIGLHNDQVKWGEEDVYVNGRKLEDVIVTPQKYIVAKVNSLNDIPEEMRGRVVTTMGRSRNLYDQGFVKIMDDSDKERIITKPGKVFVPYLSYFALGNSITYSEDSRHTGPVRRDQIIGKVVQ